MTPSPIVVIGAGIVGVSAAIWLRRTGLDVTLIDRVAPGMGTSFGNGGVLAACANVPVTRPGLVLKGPKLLLDPDFPLFLRWPYLPRLLPWLARYLSHANEADTRRIARGLAAIVGDSLEQHQALARGTPAESWLRASTYAYAYRDRAAFEADSLTWGLRRDAGVVPEILEGSAVQEAEPCLGPETGLLAVMGDHGYVLDPGEYVASLARGLDEMGGQIIRAEVKDLELSAGRISAVVTDKGRFACANAVLSTGVWSRPLMKKLGLDVPLETERGYHIVFTNPSEQLRNPLMIASGQFVATPMAQGLRCAGIVEFGGLQAGPSTAPFKLLRKGVRAAFPGLKAEQEIEWMGHRPALSDSLPIIGEVRKTGVIAAFGHHHIGLTGGPKTGRMVADIIAGNHPNIDLRPYAPERFAKKGV